MGTDVALGLGSNMGVRIEQLSFGVERLSGLLSDLRCSEVYETDPIGPGDQPDFLNLCCVATTNLRPSQLLSGIRRIETEAGRSRDGRQWSPRTLDIDLLLYGDQVIDRPELRVPHPRMTERAFVLIPLERLSPGWRHPATGQTIQQLARDVKGETSVRRWQGNIPPELVRRIDPCGE